MLLIVDIQEINGEDFCAALFVANDSVKLHDYIFTDQTKTFNSRFKNKTMIGSIIEKQFTFPEGVLISCIDNKTVSSFSAWRELIPATNVVVLLCRVRW